MRICIVTHSVIKGDGQGRVNYEVVWEALRQGHHVTLVASEICPDLQAQPRIIWIEISVRGIPSTLLSNLAFSAKSASWLEKNRMNFDLVNTNGAITSAHSDINSIHFVHSSWLKSPAHTSRVNANLYGFYQWLYSSLNAYWEKQALSRSKVIIAVSEKIRQEILEIGIPDSQIRVIYNGVDPQEFIASEGDRSGDRNLVGLPEGVPIAFFIGDIRTPRKNLDTVLKALQQTPNLHLAIAGKTDGSPYLKLANDLGVSDRVHFLGFRRDIVKIMQSVDLFVFPSRYEPFALVLLEAMATGLPIITTSNVGGAALVTPECGIVLQDCENSQDLSDAFVALSSDPEKCHRMGKASRAIAEKYTWKEMASQYVQIFEEVSLCT